MPRFYSSFFASLLWKHLTIGPRIGFLLEPFHAFRWCLASGAQLRRYVVYATFKGFPFVYLVILFSQYIRNCYVDGTYFFLTAIRYQVSSPITRCSTIIIERPSPRFFPFVALKREPEEITCYIKRSILDKYILSYLE